MLRSTLALVLVSFSLTALVGCSGGPDSDEGTSPPASSDKDPAKTSDSTDPSGDGKSEPKPAPKDEESSLGPQCTAYLACCDEIAEEQPALAGSCDQTRKSIEDATEKGASTETYESSCKQALSAIKGAGYCE